ncbi:hypothetical protein LCGC14_1072700 [marine sediment metagenome]|uniref:Uncharacterized protein n=1 Tax=marine sediment metagenome TaxID=412755 RepID=A0A0F9QNK9_9ZZZZ
MSNMGYCRFQNTLSDLRDCYDSMDDNDLSEEEAKARKRLVKLCQEITENYGNEAFTDEGLVDGCCCCRVHKEHGGRFPPIEDMSA